MSFDFSTLITDRTAADVNLWQQLKALGWAQMTQEQQTQWAAGLKGAYNPSIDMNRVTAAMEELNTLLLAAGYTSGYTPLEISRQPITPLSPLPAGYTQLEYIESTGTQWIDTGFKPNQNTKVVTSINISSSGTAGVFGCRDSVNVNTFVFWILNSTQIRSDYGSSAINFDVSESTGFSLITKDKNNCFFNNYEIVSPEQSFQSQYSIIIFSMSTSGIIDSRKIIGKLYYFDVYDNDHLSMHCVPCVNQSAEIGLYDTVGKKFYGNSGTGVFTAGPEVTPEPEPNPLDPYTWYKSDTVSESEGQQYLDNVSKIRDTLSVFANTPTVPSSLVGINYTGANDIESILLAVKQIYDNMTSTVNLAWTMGLADVGLYGGT